MSLSESHLHALDQGAVLLTANQRLARHYHQLYVDWQLSKNKTTWETPSIYFWNVWLSQCWLDFTESGSATKNPYSLLSYFQEKALWESVIQKISESKSGLLLLNTASIVRTASDARRLMKSWLCAAKDIENDQNEDVINFCHCLKAFEARCNEQGWIDNASLPDEFIKLLAENHEHKEKLPKWFLLAGFDEYTPQQEKLWDALASQDINIETIVFTEKRGKAARITCDDKISETRIAARWARSLLDRKMSENIGIVVHDLADQRNKIEKIFNEVLTPDTLLEEKGGHARSPFNITLGQSLASYPVVNDALRILKLGREYLNVNELGLLMRSAFLASADEEMNARALCDEKLRRKGEHRLKLASFSEQLSYFSARTPACSCPVLINQYNKLRSQAGKITGKKNVTEWITLFSDWLAILGWPGERALDSTEYQAVEAFRNLFSDYACIEVVTGKLTYEQALHWLRKIVTDRIFQPESKTAPIQVLGVYETAGLHFEHLWITGLDDESWPASPGPNPFIPLTLQRSLSMPHVNAERELEVTQMTTRRLLACAHEVVISYARHDNDQEKWPSPLIVDLPEIEAKNLVSTLSPFYLDAVHATRPELDPLVDEKAPAVDGVVNGGTGIFKSQSECPFMAFARFRLHARPLESPEPGLDARDRGTLVHEVLADLWNTLKSQEKLLSLNNDQRRLLVEEHVDAVLERNRKRSPESFKTRFYQLERQRLNILIMEWLQYELQRPPFECIAPESKQKVNFAGLPVTIILDRIDKAEDGRHILIDYKTGKASLNQWESTRPDEPQLPLYCVTHSEKAGAVAFALIKRGESGFCGIAEDDGILPALDQPGNSKTKWVKALHDWESLQSSWKSILENLANSFLQGDARLDPKKGAKTCGYCDMAPVCRICSFESSHLSEPLTGESDS